MERRTQIVIIDDDLASVEVLVKLLRKAGHEVCYFYDGASGLAHIKERKPDLVLSDMLLPNLHGLDLCRRLKNDEELRHIPVVLMTGVYRDPRNRNDVVDAGADGFYTKPFDLARMVNDLQVLLGHGSLEVADEEVKEEIEAVTDAYLQALPTKIRELRLLTERVRSKSGSPEALAYLHLQIHALAGSSATFAFNGLSKWAAAASSYLRNILDRKTSPTDLEYDQIESFLYEIQANSPVPIEPTAKPKTPPALGVGPAVLEEERRVVFLVEPDLGLANELTLEMELFGFEVRQFADEAALLAERIVTPDAVVMSFEMPEGQLLKVRESPRYRIAPLVFISSTNSMQARLAAIRVGGDAFLVKPLDTGILVHKIHDLTQPQRLTEPRVLLVSSDRAYAATLVGVMEQAELLVRTVFEPTEVLASLRAYSPDVLLVDATLMGCSAQELVKLFHQDQYDHGIALIVLIPADVPLLAEELLALGVDEILTKPIKAGSLVARLTHRSFRFRALRMQMVRDSLTGLLNPTSLMHNLGVELERARRRSEELCVAQIDIDQLKDINRMFGYLAGNVALRSLAGMLTRRLRHTDVLGRYEGPTLVVVLPDTNLAHAQRILGEVLTDFAMLLHHADQQEFYATLTCGIANYPRFKEMRTLLETSHAALLRGKHLGGNRLITTE